MKRIAFTMIELVFVIVVIGIVSATIIPTVQRDVLAEAANQLTSHIRYTQHLAMVDDKYDANERFWFKRRWMLRFQQNLAYTTLSPNNTYNNVWAYTIASDLPNFNGHNPDLNGMARNPLNANQYLSGGYDNTLHVEDSQSMKELRLGDSYGIKDVDFSGGCRSNVMYINFDHLGRPFNSFPNNSPYEKAPVGWHKLITSACLITLCNVDDCSTAANDEKITIGIEPETGYVCTWNLSKNSCN
jgi:type II secretory pathway pseudopilin PulG